MADQLLKALQKKYGRVTYYESSQFGDSEYYFWNVEVFRYPLFVFHLLRKLAIFFDHLADFIRELIRKNTDTKEQLRFKLPKKST